MSLRVAIVALYPVRGGKSPGGVRAVVRNLVGGLQAYALLVPEEPLQGGFIVNQRDHDVAVLGRSLPPHDGKVAFQDARFDHAFTPNTQAEIGPLAPGKQFLGHRNRSLNMLLGQKRGTRHDAADERDLDDLGRRPFRTVRQHQRPRARS